MAEDVKPEVIKRTQASLGKYIKRPPLTEKLLNKPPFRFLHDIVTSVMRDTGFLQGLLTDEELNHENIKDRESKVAFLQKVIDAVKAITGANLTVRPTKIVAGHEATKTNELLQAIGSALDNKLSSANYVAQIQKKEKGSKEKSSSSKDDASKNKASSTSKTTGRQSRGPSQERSRSKEPSKKKISTDITKRSKPRTEKKTEEEQGAAAGSISAVAEVTPEQPAKPTASTSKSDTPLPEKNKSTSSENEKPISGPSQPEKHEADASQSEKLKTDTTLSGKRRPDSARREKLKSATSIKPDLQLQPSVSEVEPQPKIQQGDVSHVKELDAGKVQEDADQTAKEPEVVRPRTAHENRRKSARLKSAKGPKLENNAVDTKGDIPPESHRVALDGAEPIILGNRDSAVPLPRPTSVRPKSARPPFARPKSRIEVVTADVTVEGEGKVKVITENDPFREQDEDDNFVVVEAPPVLLEDMPFAPASTQALQPGEDSQHGHLVAQILETQKELEDDAQRSLPHDSQNKNIDIEWDDAGRQREREIVSKEVERLRTSIQTLTRAANPLGKLMDFLQEDVDTMQRELSNWRIMNNDLRKQLLEEERKTELSTEPLKARLEELKGKIELKLAEISSVKARIMENEDNIRRNATSMVDTDPELEEKLKKFELNHTD